jgi:hypothetical protein
VRIFTFSPRRTDEEMKKAIRSRVRMHRDGLGKIVLTRASQKKLFLNFEVPVLTPKNNV